MTPRDTYETQPSPGLAAGASFFWPRDGFDEQMFGGSQAKPTAPRHTHTKKGAHVLLFPPPTVPVGPAAGEPTSPLFATAYNAALQASTREELIALQAEMRTRAPDNPALRAPLTEAVMAWAEGRPITRAQAMLVAGQFGVSVEHITRNREILD